MLICWTRSAFCEIRILIWFLKYEVDNKGLILTLLQFLPILYQCFENSVFPLLLFGEKRKFYTFPGCPEPKSDHWQRSKNHYLQICVFSLSLTAELHVKTLRTPHFDVSIVPHFQHVWNWNTSSFLKPTHNSQQ